MSLPKFYAKVFTLVIASTYVEKKLLPEHSIAETLNAPSSIAGLPRSYGMLLLMLTFTCFWTMAIGMNCGKARQKYNDKAKKDGEKDVEERFSLPNLYATGNTKNARAFNCVQRSHQHVMETLPQYFLTALVAGLGYPLSTTLNCTLWLVARDVWVKGYANPEGDPAKRYSHPLASYIWTCLMFNFIVAIMTAVNIVAGEDGLFW